LKLNNTVIMYKSHWSEVVLAKMLLPSCHILVTFLSHCCHVVVTFVGHCWWSRCHIAD